MTGIRRIAAPYSYSSAVAANDFALLGLHRGLGDTFAAQLDDALSHISGTLDGLGLTLADLVQVNVRLKTISDVPEMEKRFNNYFEDGRYPARTGGTTEFIDSDCLLMIDGVACRKEGEMTQIRRIPTRHSFSSAVAVGDLVFLAHHRGFGDGFVAQFDDTFAHLKKTLAEFDLTLAQLLKVDVRPKNITDLPEMEKRFNDYFEEDAFPARMTSTTEFINDDCLLMIDGIACRKSK